MKQLSLKKISRQHRSFLLLELLIAITLIGTLALPVVNFPLQALREEIKSIYRIETQRLADKTFAEFKADLYSQKIRWEDLAQPRKNKVKILDDLIQLSLEPLSPRKFKRKATVHSCLREQEGQQWRLVTFYVTFAPCDKQTPLFRGQFAAKKDKRKKRIPESYIFTYQVVVGKKPMSIPEHSVPTIQAG